MKKTTTLKKTLNEISKMSRIMPRSINEAIDYNGLEDEEMDMPEADAVPAEEPEVAPEVADVPATEKPAVEEPKDNGHDKVQQVPSELREKVASFVDNIRKMSLKGMSELADYPNSQEYDQLSKLWKLCDKKPDMKGGLL